MSPNKYERYKGELSHLEHNDGKLAASFCRQVAALVPDMFCNFYLVKNYIVAKNSTTKVSEEIIRTIKFYLIKLATDFY
jgi:hypothetical protein